MLEFIGMEGAWGFGDLGQGSLNRVVKVEK